MNPKQILSFFAVLIIGFGAGFFVEKNLAANRYEPEIAKLQSQIEQAKKFFPPLFQDVRSIFGTVKEVGADTIIVEITLMNPFDESPQTRTVKITNETKIVRSERKDPAAYQREVAQFQKNIQAQSNKSQSVRLTPPNAFSQESAKISDIAVGRQISIAASENIRDKESFTAKTIVILPASTPGAIPQRGTPATNTP